MVPNINKCSKATVRSIRLMGVTRFINCACTQKWFKRKSPAQLEFGLTEVSVSRVFTVIFFLSCYFKHIYF